MDWNEVDEIVFPRLCEFALRKDYPLPCPGPAATLTGAPNDGVPNDPAVLPTPRYRQGTQPPPATCGTKQACDPCTARAASLTPSGPGANTLMARKKNVDVPKGVPSAKRPKISSTTSTGSEDSMGPTFEIDKHEDTMLESENFISSRYFNDFGWFTLEGLNRWSETNPYRDPEWIEAMDLGADNRHFTTLLIEQVKLYALSDLWGIEELCKLVVFETYEIMKFFTDYRVAMKGTLEFVSFVYDNTHPTMESSNTVDDPKGTQIGPVAHDQTGRGGGYAMRTPPEATWGMVGT